MFHLVKRLRLALLYTSFGPDARKKRQIRENAYLLACKMALAG
jgi:hypothetical protein